MATVLGECNTEEQRSIVRFFCGQKDLMQRILIKKYFLFTVGPRDFHLFGPLKNHLGGRRFADDEEVETEVRKWLRQ
jgi:hypothetical protein